MKVSIITVSFNSGNTILDTIESVKKQIFEDIEYIIIDGGSTDSTLNIINSNLDVIDEFVSEPDYGLYHAMNKGIKLANGEIVGFLNSDDLYYDENVISNVVNTFFDGDIDAS